MVETVNIEEANGTGPTYTTLTSSRYCTSDTYNPGLDYPIPIPAAGSFNRSYWKSHCLNLGGTFTTISNIKFYSDGNIGWQLGTSGGVYVATLSSGDAGLPTANYKQAGGTPGVTGYSIWDTTNGIPYYSGQTPALVTSYTSASPLNLDSTQYTSTGRSKFVVTQVVVSSDATHGTQAAETFTFRYDVV